MRKEEKPKRKVKKQEKHSSEIWEILAGLGGGILLLALLFGAAWLYHRGSLKEDEQIFEADEPGADAVTVYDEPVKRALKLEAGEPFPAIGAFLKDAGQKAEFAADPSLVDTKKPGIYAIDILVDGIAYTTMLRVEDTTAPEVEVRNLTVYEGDAVSPQDFIASAEDATELSYRFEAEIGQTAPGDYPVAVLVTDAAGNQTRKEAVLTVVKLRKKIIDVPLIRQHPQLPTGCESTSAAMVLQYYGLSVSKEEFAENWLECSNEFYRSGRGLCGPNPYRVFVGDPFSENGYGCFAPAIVRAVNGHSTECRAEEIDGRTLADLCSEYIDRDMPVLVWATIHMEPSSAGSVWYLEDGAQFTWNPKEHCLVLVGYSDDRYFFNDPLSGRTVSYQKELAESRYRELGSQAVLIRR